jgi:hypothetical protein
MSVKYQHEEYTTIFPKWKRCRDASDGQDAIYAAGDSYLPKLSDQELRDYESYLKRAPFFNATWRTIAGLQGMMFRKPPTIVVPGDVASMIDNITMDGTSLHLFALDIAEESLTVGRVGIFVDYPNVDATVMTAADAALMNLRPIMKKYETESIINWKTRMINNATVLSMVVLQECAYTAKDEFEDIASIQYRVLDLVDTVQPDGSIKALYRVRVMISLKDEDITISEVYPRINNSNISFIPFYFIGVDDVTSEVDTPPLMDLVDINLSHFRTTADYEHGCHFTGLPTPVISGYTPTTENEKFYIGSMSAWIFTHPNAKATYLEFTGQGLQALEKNLERKEQQMAVLGARMLESTPGAVQSANTATIHRGGEQSMLASIAQVLSIGMQRALETFCEFAGAGKDCKFDLNRDFFPMNMEPLALTALVAGWQAGAYNYDTLFDNLKQGEIIALETTIEEELAGMDKHKPIIPGGTQVNQDGKPITQPGAGIANPTIRQLQTPPKQ